MAHGENSSTAGVWRAGSLSADELERLAGAIRPSWEIGIDAADEAHPSVAASVAVVTPTSEGFSAAPTALQSDLGAMLPAATPAVAVTVASSTAAETAAPAAPLSTPPAPKVEPVVTAAPARAQSVPAPRPNATPAFAISDDEPVAPKRSGIPMVGLLAGGAVVLLAVLFFAFRGGSDEPTAQTTAPVSTAATVPPSVSAPAPVPEAVAPSPAPALAVDPPSAPGRVAATRPAPQSGSSAPAPASANRRSSSSSRPAAARRPRGVGFVTDSPY